MLSNRLNNNVRPKTPGGWLAYEAELEEELATREPFSFSIITTRRRQPLPFDKCFVSNIAKLVEPRGVKKLAWVQL